MYRCVDCNYCIDDHTQCLACVRSSWLSTPHELSCLQCDLAIPEAHIWPYQAGRPDALPVFVSQFISIHANYMVHDAKSSSKLPNHSNHSRVFCYHVHRPASPSSSHSHSPLLCWSHWGDAPELFSQGVPGFAYVLCQVDALKRSQGTSRSLTMDSRSNMAMPGRHPTAGLGI